MPNKKYNIEEVAEIVSSEGLGYAVQEYLSSNKIEDNKLSTLWQECSDVMKKIHEILEPYMD